MKRALQDSATTAAAAATSGGCGGEEKAKIVMMMPEDAGDDELLAALGYKVRTSSMADVAQKLEQLEMAMSMSMGDGSAATSFGSSHSSAVVDENSIVSHLASETVHYNPSDLSNWLEKMLSELNIPPPPPTPPPPLPESSLPSTAGVPSGKFVDDLSAIIPGGPEMKRLKPNPPFASPTAVVASPPAQSGGLPSTVVVLESQDAGVQLVHALLACAEAVQQGNLSAAKALVEHIGVLSLSTAGAMRKVATFFAEALARRIYNLRATPPPPAAISASELHFYESCPYLKFAHFTANQAILEAFSGKDKVHVIDFSINHGLQWPALLQALSLRPGGPPAFKLTGVGPSSVQGVGEQLAQLADTVRVKFEYRPLIAKSLSDLESYMLDVEEDEAVAVNSVFELHKLLNRPGSLEKLLGLMKALKPSMVAVVEEEANHNGPVFLERFTEALHYYSSMFDSVESSAGGDRVMSEVHLGGQICNIVACEGAERVERHETAEQWRRRMVAAGFDSVALGSNAYKQASMLLECYEGADGYRVDEKDGCLMLGWHTRPLITTSAWRVAPPLPKRVNPV